jgi:hypothetical protein
MRSYEASSAIGPSFDQFARGLKQRVESGG